MHFNPFVVAVLLLLLEIPSILSQDDNRSCQYGENCGMCFCDFSRCLICNENGQCVCPEGMLYNENNQSCILNCPEIPLNYGEPCNNTDPNCQFCAKDLECDGGICICKRGSYYKRSEKKCFVYPGENCEVNPNCTANSKCINGTCTCKRNFIQDHHKCLLSYNATCRQFHKCHRGVHLECVNAATIIPERKKKTRKLNSWKCKCIAEGELYFWSKHQNRCIALHGTGCDKERDVCVVNSFCNPNSSKCECHEGFTPVNKRCLEKCNNISKNITHHFDNCGPFKVCNNTFCTCKLKKMVYDDCGECRLPLAHACGEQSNNYTCDTGLICSETCGKCTFPDTPRCSSCSGYLNILMSTVLFSFMILVTN